MGSFFAADSRKHRKRVAHGAAEELPPEIEVEELSIEDKEAPLTGNSITDNYSKSLTKVWILLKSSIIQKDYT
jgi:hypothetical protein